ncbi:hypothetical protein BROUX41_001553 [Berkeleyomyces rouxiae]|uniref:uncharacterized protein n=1 Tax=Berkeleyomyces rouxiae TaxID=2035830 RepID=UPI003B7D3D07
MQSPCPRSSDPGFFQEMPVLENQYYDDVVFQRALNLFVPQSLVSDTRPDLVQLGRDVIAPSIFEWISDAERHSPDIQGLRPHALGQPNSQPDVGEGWRRLHAFGQSRGLVACGYENKRGPFDRVIQFLRFHLWEASNANVVCVSAMQDGAARLLQKHLSDPALDPTRRTVFQNAFDHLTSRDSSSAWTTGQWVIERSEDSDLSDTETIATRTCEEGSASTADGVPLGPWSLSGCKWISSAIDSQIAIVLARTENGLSTFLAPLHRVNSASLSAEINGVRVLRRSDKAGMRSLSTSELELDGMRGWLIGGEGRGINEMAVILNITRVHSAIAAMGYVGRGLAIAKAYARVRTVRASRGKRTFLAENSLHLNTLANMTAEYQGLMLLSVYSAYVLGLSEHLDAPQVDAAAAAETAATNPILAPLTPPVELVAPLLRVLTQLTKAYVCKHAIPILYSCMEAMGGAGCLHADAAESLNVSRIYRDCSVLAVWDGTTDALSADFVRTLTHARSGAAARAALDHVVRQMWALVRGAWDIEYRPVVAWEDVKRTLANHTPEQLAAQARQLLFDTAEALIVLMLKVAAMEEKTSASKDIFSRFVESKRLVSDEKLRPWTVVQRLARDQTVVYGGIVDEDVQPRL